MGNILSFDNEQDNSEQNNSELEIKCDDILFDSTKSIISRSFEIPTLRDVKLYCLKMIVNIITSEDKFYTKDDKLFLYLCHNNCISNKMLLAYLHNSDKGSFFYSEIDKDWLLDFIYLFYFDRIIIFDQFRNNRKTNKNEPYDTHKDIKIVKYQAYISQMIFLMLESKEISNEENLCFQFLNESLIPKSNMVKKLAEQYPLLFFKIIKYLFENDKEKYQNIVDYFIESLWYTASYQFFKQTFINKN